MLDLNVLPWERVIEVMLRTVLIFFFTFVVMRIRGKRQLVQMNLFDFVIIIGLGSAVGDAAIYTEEVAPMLASMITVATVIILIWIIENILEVAPARLANLIEGTSTILVLNGRIDRKALGKVNLREEALMAKLREKDVERLSQVKVARLEPDGVISVIRKKRKRKQTKR